MVQNDIETKRAELLERLEQLERDQEFLSLDDVLDVEEFRKRIDDIRRETASLMQTRGASKK